MTEEFFDIHVIFAYGGDDEPMIEKCTASGLKDAIHRLMYGPFASIGGIKSFKIIDSGDFVVFSVSDGKITYPTNKDSD